MKLICFILSLSLYFSSTAQSNLFFDSHIQKFKRAKEYTHKIADLMSVENFDFKPTSEEMSFKDQLIHIGENIYWLSSTYIIEADNPGKKVFPKEALMTKEKVLLFVDGAYDFAINAMENVDVLTAQKEFPWKQNLKLNKLQFLNLIQDHQSHHVGQLIVYLRLKGIQPPQYVGW